MLIGQNTLSDSLGTLLSKENSSQKKLEILSELVSEFNGSDLKKAMEYARKGVMLAEQSGNKTWQPKFYEMKGRIHANSLELDSASIYFNKALNGYKITDNKKGQATTLFKIGWVHKKRGEVDKALSCDLDALKLMESIGDKLGMVGAYSRISDDLIMHGRHKEALNYALKTINVSKENGFKEDLAFGYTAAGTVSIHTGKNEDALNYFEKALDLAAKLGFDPSSLSDFRNNKGNALKRLGRYKEALTEYHIAMDLAKKVNYTNAISALTANLGEVNLRMGNYSEALKFQLETVRLQEKDGDLANLTENYGHVSTIYEKLGDYKSALEFQKKARKMRDSTAAIESDKAMAEMLTKYQTEQKESTISAQERQISQQKTVQWLSVGLVVLLVGFLIFGYHSYQLRTKANKLLLAKNAENELLLKEIHHRVKNNLEVVSSLLALQSAQLDDQHTKDAMQEGQNRVMSIGIVHQKLYQGENLGAIEMKDYLINLSESILDSFGAEKKVTVECAMEKLNVDIDTAVPLGLIVNELLTNTLKYAFPDDKHGKVQIKLEKQENGLLHLEVSDNGVGKSGQTHGTGFGSQLISLLTQQLGGSMREVIQDGTRVYFDFYPSITS